MYFSQNRNAHLVQFSPIRTPISNWMAVPVTGPRFQLINWNENWKAVQTHLRVPVSFCTPNFSLPMSWVIQWLHFSNYIETLSVEVSNNKWLYSVQRSVFISNGSWKRPLETNLAWIWGLRGEMRLRTIWLVEVSVRKTKEGRIEASKGIKGGKNEWKGVSASVSRYWRLMGPITMGPVFNSWDPWNLAPARANHFGHCQWPFLPQYTWIWGMGLKFKGCNRVNRINGRG